MDKTIVFSVVRNIDVYRRCIQGNSFFAGCRLVFADNRMDNCDIPIRHNRFLDSLDYGVPPWIVFCHEDFDLQEELQRVLSRMPKDSICGPCGASRRKYLNSVCRWETVGQIQETFDCGTRVRTIGNCRPDGYGVDCLDCMCLVVHSDLVRKFGLRFDENLSFDLYAEDFSINAFLKYGVKTRLLNMRCVHRSRRKEITESYFRSLGYLNAKYPDHCFCGTCSYIGGGKLERRFCGPVLKFLRGLSRVSSAGHA